MRGLRSDTVRRAAPIKPGHRMVLIFGVGWSPQNTLALSESNVRSPTALTPWHPPTISPPRSQPIVRLSPCSHPRVLRSLGLTEMARLTHNGLPLSFANSAFAESEPPSANTAGLNGFLGKRGSGYENATAGVTYRDDLLQGV